MILSKKNRIIQEIDPIYFLKSIKNKTEIKNIEKAHLNDGVALTKFLFWIKNSYIKKLDELKIEKKIESFRKKNKNNL